MTKAEQLITTLLETMTTGVKNAIAKGRVKEVCSGCNFPIPVYPGRYPKLCVSCGEVITRDEVEVND